MYGPKRRSKVSSLNPGPVGIRPGKPKSSAGRGRGGTAATGPAVGALHKKWGQHLLKNTGILDKIVQAASIKSGDTVLEIGPGTGNLTMRLLPLSRRVVAFDIDERMVAEVKKRAFGLGFRNLEVRAGDALRSDLGVFDVCTANLPYQISSPFVFRLLAHRPLFRCAVLMFQAEFAERLLAVPSTSAYCRLSVNAQLFCKVDRVCKVAPGSFAPPPQVDSMVVKLTPRQPQPEVNFREWDGLVRIAFHRKHKTLRAAFTTQSTLRILEDNYKTVQSLMAAESAQQPAAPVDNFKQYVIEALEECGASSKRGSDIPMEDFFLLLLAFNKRGIHFANKSTGAAASTSVPSIMSDDDDDAVQDIAMHDDD